MKTALHFRNVFFALLLIPALALANNNDRKGKSTKEKTLHEEYTVSPNATVEIDNSYGNIDVVTWNENRVVIDVTITTTRNAPNTIATTTAMILYTCC